METSSDKPIRTLHDLSIYEASDLGRKEIWVAIETAERTPLETLITSVRRSLCSTVQQAKKSTEQISQYFDQSKKLADTQLTQLRHESVILPKVVFISLSTMSGFLIGFRRSTARKIVYSGILGVASTALVFPNEARDYTSKASELASRELGQLYRTYVWPEKQRVKTTRSEEQTTVFSGKDKVIKLPKGEADSGAVDVARIAGDKGMSNDDDKDMYTTRSK